MEIRSRQMLEDCRRTIYNDLTSLVVQPRVDPEEHTDAISAEFDRIEKKKELETGICRTSEDLLH